MEFLSFELRSDAMLMIQPMGVLVLCGCCFTGQKLYLKCRPLFEAGIILLTILIIGKGSHYIFYSSPGWKEYEKVNDAVTEITDYAAIPDYAEVQDILSKYNVTQKQYNAFLQYAMIEENLSGDCLLEVAAVAHEKNLPPSFSLVVKQFLTSYASREHWGLNMMLIASWPVSAESDGSAVFRRNLFPVLSFFSDGPTGTACRTRCIAGAASVL